MRSFLIIAAAGLAMSGCKTADESLDKEGNDTRYVCNAAPVQGLIGQLASQPLGTDAMRTSGARTVRWIAPGQAVTMDFRNDRLNIHLDAQNRITQLTCG